MIGGDGQMQPQVRMTLGIWNGFCTWQYKIYKIFTIQKNRMEQYKVHRPLWDDILVFQECKYTWNMRKYYMLLMLLL